MFKKVISVLLVIGVTAALTSCTSKDAGDSNKYTATVEADSYYVPAEVTGKVLEVNAAEGNEIKSGSQVARIDTESYEIQKRQAEANLKLAKAKQSELPDNAKDALKDEAQAAVDLAQASVDAAQLLINKGTVTSTQDGVVEEVLVNRGELATAGMNLMKITDMKSKYIKVYIEESKRNLVKLGDSIPVYSDGNKVSSGKIIYIAQQSEFTPKNTETKSDKEKTLFEVKIKLENGNELVPGMLVDVEIK